MQAELTGRKLLVTGASGGIGAAIVRLAAGEGATVVAHGHTQAPPTAARVTPLRADLTDEAAVARLFAEAVADGTPLDGLVVNHGVWPAADKPLHELSLAQWRRTIDVDLTSAFLCCRAFLRQLAEAPRAQAGIVLVGSTAALFGEAGHADYASAKAGLIHGLLPSLKNEIVRLAPRGRVNGVCPGWTVTPMAAAALEEAAVVARVQATMALKKVATPDDVARAVVFLLSDELAGHISGAVLPVAGGMEGRLLT